VERASFRILGSVETVRGGDVLNLGPPKQRAFLALLLTRANQTVPRDRLIDSLWEGEPPATAVKALQVFASRLRKALGPDADTLATSGNGYLVRIDEERLDRGPAHRDRKRPQADHSRTSVTSIASTGPSGCSARYCSYFAVRSARAWARSSPSSSTRARPRRRIHQRWLQSSS
jgi:DNA-binding SARP family transcriptional activator